MLKDFLMTLAATTVSIILTFGTSAVIDRNKKDAAKREMVMMIMYDMNKAISDIEDCDKNLKEFFDIQVDIVAHPEKFDDGYYGLLTSLPIFEYPTTTENIFKSNIETVNTISRFAAFFFLWSMMAEVPKVRTIDTVVAASVKRKFLNIDVL